MKLVNIKIRRRPDEISGVEIHDNESWLLIKHNPVDYVLDGYGLINKSYLSNKSLIESNDIKFKIMSFKVDDFDGGINLDLGSSINLFNSIMDSEMLIQLELESDDYCLIGFISKVNQKSFILKKIDTNGNFSGEENIKFSTVRNIYFKNDYLISYENYMNSL